MLDIDHDDSAYDVLSCNFIDGEQLVRLWDSLVAFGENQPFYGLKAEDIELNQYFRQAISGGVLSPEEVTEAFTYLMDVYCC